MIWYILKAFFDLNQWNHLHTFLSAYFVMEYQSNGAQVAMKQNLLVSRLSNYLCASENWGL